MNAEAPKPDEDANPTPGKQQSHKDHAPWVVSFVLATMSTVGMAAFTDPPDGPVAWALFIACVALLALASSQALTKLYDKISNVPPKRRRAALKVAVVAVVAMALLGGIWWVSRPLLGSVQVLLFGCTHPAEVRVLTTPELLATYRDLAGEFERSAAERNHDCRPTQLHVYAPPAAAAREGLAAGWSAEYLRDLGPRPDIWLPETKLHVDEVQAKRAVTGFVPDMEVIASIASTPIVLGVPASAGIRQDDPAWRGKPWAELIRNLQGKRLGLIRPSPAASTVGDFGTVAIYTSDGGSVGLRENPARARAFEQWVDGSFAAGRYPAGGDGPALLRRQRELGAASQPMVVSEQELARYNEEIRGRNGRGCNVENGPEGCLLAFYPSDTHRLDMPFARLSWPEGAQSTQQRKAATDFGAWLTGPEGRKALIAGRLRPHGTPVLAPLVEANGVLPGGPQLDAPLDNPPPAVREEMLAVRQVVKRPGRVLISVDASGSMRELAGRETRFQLATKAVQGIQGHLAGREVSLNVFSATIGIQPVDLVSLTQVRPSGNTPQYRAILEGMRAVGQGGVLVVLTDGTNNVNDVAPQQLLEQTGARVMVLAFGEASCATQALIDVTNKTGGSCRQAGVGSLDADLAELLRGV